MIYLGDATQLSELHLISTKERDQGDCQISNMIEKRFTGSKLKINPETDRVQIQLHLIVAMNPSYAHETLLSSLRIFTYYPIEELDAMNMMHPQALINKEKHHWEHSSLVVKKGRNPFS